MSTSLSISIDMCKDHFPEFYIDLVRRMRGPVEDPEVYTFRVPYKQRQVSMDIDDPRFEDLVRTTLESDTGLDVTMGYYLFGGNVVPLDLHFFGKRYRPPSLALTGHCRVGVSLNDVTRASRNASGVYFHAFEENADQKTFERARDALAIAGCLAIQNAEQLFFHACGLLEEEAKTSVIHCAGMYDQLNWRTPGHCSMLYHRRPEEFSRDFLRIYADYQWGALMPSMDTEDDDIWQLKDASCPAIADTSPGKENRYYDAWYETEEGRLTHAFLENLTEQRARKLSEIPGKEMRRLLLSACQRLDRPVCHDFGNLGLVLSADPMSHLWLAYVTVAEMVESGTGV